MKTHILLSSYFFLLSFSVFGQLSSTGLVAYYPFNGNANDESGNGINSTYIGTGVTLTSDRFGNPDKAYSFDGNTGSYIRMPADILPTTNRTITLWFNVPDIAGRPGLLGYGGNGSCGTSLLMGLNCSGSAKFWAQGHCGNNQAGYSYSAEPINKWYHWVLTIDGNTQKIYVNGELKSTDNTFSGSTAVAGKDLSLGVITSINGTAPYTDANVGNLTGKLDDVRIYNSALTDQQVHQLYSSESSGLVAYYPFNGNANDESTSASHATAHGATLSTDRFNNSDQAYLFNGSSDRLQVPENDVYDFGDGDFSITSWVSLNEIKTARIVSAGHRIDDGIWGVGFGSHPVWGSGLRINYFVYSGGAYRDFSSDEITGYTLGQWAMVGITKTGSTITFCFNGKKAGTATITLVSNAGSYLSIGSRQDASETHIEFLNGKIDEVRICNHGLSETEIIEEYNSTRNSLVAYYPFDGNANDESGNGHNGSVSGATKTSDRFNQADNAYNFVYNGFSSDKIQVSGTSDLNFSSGGFSIGAWVRFSGIATGGYNYPIFSKHICGEQSGYILMLYNGKLTFWLAGSEGYNVLSTTDDYTDNSWHQVVAVYDGTNQYLYVDGILKNSIPFSYTSFNSANWALGGYNGCNGGFNGKVDEIKVFDQALTESEVKNLYNNSVNSLIAYFPFNGNANDESGNGHDGTINGNATLTTDRYMTENKAFTFPDQSSSISLANSSNTNLENGFSINAWVKYKNTYSVIVGKHVCGFVNGFVLGIDYDGQIQLWLANSGWSTVRTNCTYNEGQWYMVTASYHASTGIAKIYVNGEISGTGNVNYNNFSSHPISIGEAYQNNCQPANMAGAVDEVKIYDRPLSDAEISQEYTSSRSSLVAYFPFNGNANDESGNGNNGTITGPLVTPVADRYGEEGKAYKFWFPDYVSVPTNSSFFSDEFTVSYWYKVASYWGDQGVMSCVGNKGGYQQAFSGTTFSSIIGYNFPLFAHLYSNYTVPDVTNTWHHVVLSYKKTGENLSSTKLFLNGELKKTENHSLAIAYPGGEIFYIGRNHGELGLNGELDDVRFYDRVLTDAEIMELHLAETPTAVKNQFIPDVRISPNPTDEHFVVDLRSNFQKIELRILDMTGRVIKKLQYSDLQKITVFLDMPSGIYFLNITTEKGQGTYKLMKK